VAENGLVAVSAALKRPPDVILSDVEMPVMDGWTFLRMVRSRQKLAHTPFVFFTRLSDDLSRLQGYRMGVDDYLAKDTSPDEVLARIGAIVSRQGRGGTPSAEVVDNLRGDLRHVRLGSLLSFLEGEKRTGDLILEHATERVAVTLVRGAVYDVDNLGKFTHVRDRIFEMLDWAHGEFEFVASDEEYAADTQTTAVTYLLLEHARRADEGNKS
jgi:DNA-binding response OmpR family regulator